MRHNKKCKGSFFKKCYNWFGNVHEIKLSIFNSENVNFPFITDSLPQDLLEEMTFKQRPEIHYS